MTVYVFDADSKIFLGAYNPPPSPEERDGFIMPENYISTAPPTFTEGMVNIAQDGEWIEVIDNRGLWYWPNGDEITIEDINVAPDPSWTREKPEQPAPIPSEVSMFQAEEALAHFGYLDAVEALMAHEDTPDKFKRAWRRATSVKRDAEVVGAMAALIPLTDENLDELFTYAFGVTA